MIVRSQKIFVTVENAASVDLNCRNCITNLPLLYNPVNYLAPNKSIAVKYIINKFINFKRIQKTKMMLSNPKQSYNN